jgi:1-acyl-sn-glycerol-3-phosphate acyltransferase
VLSGANNREARDHGRWALRAGHLFAILPEGDVSRGAHLHPFHGGFLKLAITEHVPVVPMITVGSEHAIRNCWNPTRFADFAPRRAKLRICFLPPLCLENPSLDAAIFAQQLDDVQNAIATHVDDMRRVHGISSRDPAGL